MSDSGLSLREAAALLSLSPRTVRRWVHAGKLKAELKPSPFGPQYCLSREHVEAVAQLRNGEQAEVVRDPGPDLEPRGQQKMVEPVRAAQSMNVSGDAELHHLRVILSETQRELQEMQRQLDVACREIRELRQELIQLRLELVTTRVPPARYQDG